MKITQFEKDGFILLIVSGKLDTNTSPELEQVLSECLLKSSKIAIDIGETEYISSAGLRVFLSIYKKCSKNGGSLRVLNPDAMARELFEMTGFHQFLTIEYNNE